MKLNGMKNESGQGLLEYTVLVMLVALVSFVSVRSLGHAVKGRLKWARDTISRPSSATDAVPDLNSDHGD